MQRQWQVKIYCAEERGCESMKFCIPQKHARRKIFWSLGEQLSSLLMIEV